MAIFPRSKTIRPAPGYRPSPKQLVKRTESEAGDTQIRDGWGRTRFVPDNCIFTLTIPDAEIVQAFWELNRTNTFYNYDYDTRDVTPGGSLNSFAQIGTGNGATTTFTVLACEITNVTVYDNGSPVASSAYTITRATGPNLEDQIVFTVAPLNTHVITIAFRGCLRYLAEMPAEPTIESAGYNKRKITVPFREVFP